MYLHYSNELSLQEKLNILPAGPGEKGKKDILGTL